MFLIDLIFEGLSFRSSMAGIAFISTCWGYRRGKTEIQKVCKFEGRQHGFELEEG